MMLASELIALINKYGFWTTLLKACKYAIFFIPHGIKVRYYRFKHRDIQEHRDPTADELISIEKEFRDQGVEVRDFEIDVAEFQEFKSQLAFPADYHGGVHSGVWDEKMLEHFIAYKILALASYKKEDVYIDAAACGSPWVKILRDKRSVQAYAVDLAVKGEYKKLPYYRCEDATKTSFHDSSVKGISLHCAFEMFMRKDDVNLIKEISRILQPGGQAVIVPLYMHTHYCSYSSPECWGKGYSDQNAIEYIRRDMYAIPSARFYNVANLQERILHAVKKNGLHYRVHAVRNKMDISPSIYCHFILEITK